MRKPFIYLVLCTLLATSINAQNIFVCGYGTSILPEDICSFHQMNAFTSNVEAEDAVNDILRKMGLPKNFALARCPDIENAVAITSKSGDRYIIYDNDFIRRISQSSSDWGALSVLVHEIGHHLSGHTIKGAADLSQSRDNELEADHFSGFWMYKLGATLSQAQQAVRLVARERDDRYSSHPKLSRRLAAIEQGYILARSESGGEPTPKPQPRDLPDMIFVEGGTFQMGSSDSDADSDETPHTVTVDDFYMHRFEVTNEEFAAFLNAKGRHEYNGAEWYDLDDEDARIEQRGGTYSTKGSYGKHPVTEVTWYGAVAYCNWKSEALNLQPVYRISGTNVSADWNADGYRLPMEAEWEFAARSRGGSDKWAGTSSEGSLSSYGNFCDTNCGESWKTEDQNDGYGNTAPVGSFRPNDLGLKDMSGNVWEWCWDWSDSDYYKNSPSRNPRGPSTGSRRVRRGGSWGSGPAVLRCALRNNRRPGRQWRRHRVSPQQGRSLGFNISPSAEALLGAGGLLFYKTIRRAWLERVMPSPYI